MPILGAHMSIAGGYYKAVEAAAKLSMSTCQIFTKNNNQWRAKPISAEDVELFQRAITAGKIECTTSHASYLINLASPDEELWRKSLDSFLVEMQRAGQLGIPYVVVHPGSYTTSDEDTGIQRIAEAINLMHRELDPDGPMCLLENTAGQGSALGWRFEHLARMLDAVQHPERLGICLDTCHTFAAGYPLGDEAQYAATMDEFDRIVGIERIRVVHVNDSKAKFGSRVDRHAHIGEGEMGREPFRLLLADPRFAQLPMYLETPKGTNDEGEDWDAVNLRTLQSLLP